MLKNIKSPRDLKKLSLLEQQQLCKEIRLNIIQTVSKTGGHLSSNLGVVELTVALHTAFDSPNDKIIWDVGHQSYTHKLLTGRQEEFSKLRHEGGVAGFPRPNESAHDCFVGGHASNSISAACGIARAELLKGSNRMVIAVIGDGSFTGGMAYEALNNAADLKNLIVILNYNEMSISKTVGGLARYFSNMRANQTYLQTRQYLDHMLDKTPLLGKPLKEGLYRSKLHIKKLVYNADFFTLLGFSYLGNVDGHDLNALEDAISWAKNSDKPAVIQVCTKKGKGYPQAEENPGEYHSVSTFNVKTGEPDASAKNSYSETFGKELTRLAKNDRKICAVTAAMKYGTGLQYFSAANRDRFFDVGIAEEHAVTYCAGLASNGMMPVFAVYSTFLQRGFDQVIHDAAIANYHIVLAVDRAGIVGDDGETHQGVFDVSFLSLIPNVTIFSPASYLELKAQLSRAIYQTDGVVAVRYPRGGQPGQAVFGDSDADFQLCESGKDCLMVTYGRLSYQAHQAMKELGKAGLYVSLLKLNRIHPIPQEAVKLAAQYPAICFFEEGVRVGGVGQQLLDLLNQANYQGTFRHYALANSFISHGTVADAMQAQGLDASHMVEQVKSQCGSEPHLEVSYCKK